MVAFLNFVLAKKKLLSIQQIKTTNNSQNVIDAQELKRRKINEHTSWTFLFIHNGEKLIFPRLVTPQNKNKSAIFFFKNASLKDIWLTKIFRIKLANGK